LFDSFKENTKLRNINIADNKIKSSGEKFIEIISNLKNLQVININDCIFGEKNTLNLFEATKGLEKLKVIECAYNEVEKPKSQEKIFECLLGNKEKLKELKKVNLKGNEIDKEVLNKYSKKLNEYIEEFEAYSDEELEAELYPENEEDEHGNPRIKK